MSNHTLRTLNVHQQITGVTDSLQVNIAYEHLPSLRYLEAKEFEYELQMRIQELLFDIDQRRQFNLPPGDSAIRLIPIAKAMELTKHTNRKAFYNWRTRHNSRHPKQPIILTRCMIEENSLKRAITISKETEEEAA